MEPIETTKACEHSHGQKRPEDNSQSIPTISVIVPAYNSEAFLDTTLASIVGQTLQPTEVLLVNDCSTDRTLEIARSWERSLPLRVIDKQANQGLGAARRTAGEAAAGEFIALLDSDDVWFPDHLEVVTSLVENEHTIVTPSTLRWYPGEKTGTKGSTELFPIPPRNQQLLALLRWNYLFSGCLFTRTTYLSAGGFSKRRKNEDWELWIRMLSMGCHVVGAHTPTVLYRQHSESLSSADGCLLDDVDMFEELAQTLQGEHLKVVQQALRRRHARLLMLEGLTAQDAGDSAAARKLFIAAAAKDRSFRGGRSSQSGSVLLRSAFALVAPSAAAGRRQIRNTDPDALRTGR